MQGNAARQYRDFELDERDDERVVRFPTPDRQGQSVDNQDEAAQEYYGPPARSGRGRQAVRSSDSASRYIVTASGVFLAVLVLAIVLYQLGRLGQQGSAVPEQRTVPGAQQVAPQAQQAAPAARAGEGPLRFTSKVLEPSYTVASGHTLASNATRFGTSIDALVSINNLADRNSLKVGQKLFVPGQD